MTYLGSAAAMALIVVVLVDTFETLILPRRIAHPYRLARLFYRSTWALWHLASKRLPAGRHRNGFLSVFGPLSLLALVSIWAAGLVVGFALMHWSLRTPVVAIGNAEDRFVDYLYFSGTTFFTLGYGDLVPAGRTGRFLSVVEAGIGFGFLAVVISYLPVLYQAFSRREITISLLDARAGSPPTAGGLLSRLSPNSQHANIESLLVEWERWSAELLESHLSYPVLRFYRSQHDNQSWVASLTTILDTSAILIAGGTETNTHQARLTFAMARHAAVDVALIAHTPALTPPTDRLPASDCVQLFEALRGTGLGRCDIATFTRTIGELRLLYEPFVQALATNLAFTLPKFLPDQPSVDNWQTSAWMRRSPGLDDLSSTGSQDTHFD